MNIQRCRVVIDCSVQERAYIKMLAANKHMTISQYMISKAKEEMSAKIPNDETIAAMKELDEGKGTHHSSIEEFWADMGIERPC